MLIIGTHELRGTAEDLSQPFCVLRKKRKRQEHPSEEDNGADSPQHCHYEIAGVVRRKYVFNQYPKTIMR